MSEVYPSNSQLEGLGGTVDQPSGVYYIPKGEGLDWYASFIKSLRQLVKNIYPLTGLRVYKDGDLTFGVCAGQYWHNGQAQQYNGQTGVSLTASDTNYIYLVAGDATVTVNTTGFPDPDSTPDIQLATILTGGSDYQFDDVTDCRGSHIFTVAGGVLSLSGTSASNFTLDAENSGAGSTCQYRVNRGTSNAEDAVLEWNETDDRWEVKSQHTSGTLAPMNAASYQISGTAKLDGSGAAAIHDSIVSASKLADAVADLIPKIDISVGSESGNQIVVDIQIQDCQANNNANRFLLHAWLSDTQGGAETASTPSAGCTWGTGTVLESITANERWTVITDATGAAQVTVGEAGVDTWYLHVEIDGRIYISDAITFA